MSTLGGRTIHFLKVDVEGAEAHVFASSDWSAFRLIVVVAESIESLSISPAEERWEQLLLGAGYQFAAFDGVNRFYVERAHRHLIPTLAYPISALDGFVTGATRDLEAELHAKANEAERLRRELDEVHRSRSWRAGRAVVSAIAPIRSAGERLARRSPW